MSVGISNDQLIDLQRTTLANLPDMEFEYALTYQKYNVINLWFRNNKKQVESGESIKRNVVLSETGDAKHVRLYQKTPINVADTQLQITAPWVQAQTHYSMERREILRNRAPAAYVNLLKSRRVNGTMSLANLLELRAWSTPNSSTDDLNPRGLPYHISKGDTSINQTGAFNGKTIRFGDSSTSTTKSGIDGSQTANALWRNWTAQYDVVGAQFVKNLRRAFHMTKFESPITVTDLKEGPASDYKLYFPTDVLVEYEDLTTKQNDNLGKDLDPFHGVTTFRRVEIIHTPQLDGDVDAPVYGVNHAKFVPFVLSGDWMRESDPMQDVEQHNVITTFVDCSYQFLSINVREGGFCLHKPTLT